MSVKVSNLTKLYGQQKALNDVSFELKSGEILGFLGPNGAGKSTMMKILTCYIPQTSGKAEVCGFDVNENPIEVRKNIGYLPEHNPLYLDMYVREYLEFVAGLFKLKNVKERVSEMIEITGLSPEKHKLISALSKGYRQRVGIAQALIHNPPVLILDEPTSGLDPNQLVEIRQLIKNIGKEKTVMFSSHIMQEVEAISDRVIIINKGKIVADKKSSELQSSSKAQQIITVEFDKPVDEKLLKKISGVESVVAENNNLFKLYSSSQNDLRAAVSQFAQQQQLLILTLQKEEQKLENIFRELTQ
ncbi:MAG: gliding motility-associated ABC transporter ATP-binding subunit GldA [Bacteroidia bacterium]